ncbi:MAG: hypothetical protein GXN99_01285, partial [Candidatus Nanohaloarchaeota archaeon]|nr:hypothetical protein [Candidatus Nanohaloarchaeota archaeon]
EYTTIDYYKEGDVFDEASSYFLQKLESCGYKKVSESHESFSVPGLKILKFAEYKYEKDNEVIDFNIGVVEQNGKTYTLAEIVQTVYYESANFPEGENQNEEEQPSEVGNIPDNIQPYHGELTEIFEKVFGGATLTEYNTYMLDTTTYVILEYVLPRPFESSDILAIKDELVAKGYSPLGVQASSDVAEGYFFFNDDKNSLQITANIGDKKLEVQLVLTS